MNHTRKPVTATLAVASLASQGCVGGLIYDAETGAYVENVNVTAIADCISPDCEGTVHQQTSDAFGMYVYDGYGDTGREQLQALEPAVGNDSIHLLFSHPNYELQTVYHHLDPEYHDYQGNERSLSQVQNVYLCPQGAPDSDGDGLCDAAEATFGTNPYSADTDGDSLSDHDEIYGVNDVDLKYYGADPLHKDIFVEVDYFPPSYMLGLGYEIDVKPTQAEMDAVVAAMAAAPVDNPDGTTGIALHIFIDDEIDAADAKPTLSFEADLPTLKAKYFDARRDPAFHYAVFAYSSDRGASGSANRPGRNLALYSLSRATDTVATNFMHELGHNLGLGHGGQDSENKKPHYISVMNYRYRGSVVRDGQQVLDYSRVAVAGMSESSLNEAQAFSPAGDTTEADLARYQVRGCTGGAYAGNASQNLDMDRDGSISSQTKGYDIGCTRGTDESWGPSQVDWDVLNYSGRAPQGFVGGGSTVETCHLD